MDKRGTEIKERQHMAAHGAKQQRGRFANDVSRLQSSLKRLQGEHNALRSEVIQRSAELSNAASPAVQMHRAQQAKVEEDSEFEEAIQNVQRLRTKAKGDFKTSKPIQTWDADKRRK